MWGRMRYLMAIVCVMVLTGCYDMNMRKAKARQFCKERNSTFYSVEEFFGHYRIICKDGFTISMESDTFRKITGPEVEKYINKNK